MPEKRLRRIWEFQGNKIPEKGSPLRKEYMEQLTQLGYGNMTDQVAITTQAKEKLVNKRAPSSREKLQDDFKNVWITPTTTSCVGIREVGADKDVLFQWPAMWYWERVQVNQSLLILIHGISLGYTLTLRLETATFSMLTRKRSLLVVELGPVMVRIILPSCCMTIILFRFAFDVVCEHIRLPTNHWSHWSPHSYTWERRVSFSGYFRVFCSNRCNLFLWNIFEKSESVT